jgi:predicted SAM-dependent methyltransferase
VASNQVFLQRFEMSQNKNSEIRRTGNKMKISALIPYKADQGHRDRLWSFVRQRYEKLMPEIELCLGIDENEPFCRSRAINAAAAKAAGDVFIIVDTDVMFEPALIEKIKAVIHLHPWIIPFANGYKLTREATLRLLTQKPTDSISIAPEDIESNVTLEGALMNVMTRKAFDAAGGMDERFLGWGGEDNAMVMALDTLCGPHFRMKEDIFHLWHPPAPVYRDKYQRNLELCNRYLQAFGNVSEMRGLIRERAADGMDSQKRYRDIAVDYETYSEYQKEKYCSFESQVPRWVEGQVRYMVQTFAPMDRETKIVDVACGDGIGLRVLKEMGFADVCGVEFNARKAEMAKESGYKVFECDMHDLKMFKDHEFDVVYSSHTLEHAYEPLVAAKEFHRILKPGGILLVVLPYPDPNPENDEAHGGKYEIGTDRLDDGKSVVEFFSRSGFHLLKTKFDTFREPEIWLALKKPESEIKEAAANEVAADSGEKESGIQVHLGCGSVRIEGFVNIDVRKTWATDYVLDLNEPLPFDSIKCAFSNAFFEHLYRDKRVTHLRDIHGKLRDGGFVCYMGMPYFRNIAKYYLEGGPGTAGVTFDLYNVYRYTHGDPESVNAGNYLPQLHKSLFDEAELHSLLETAGFTHYLIFIYSFPGDFHELPVCIGFFAQKTPETDPGSLKSNCDQFLAPFDGKFLRHNTIQYLSDPCGNSPAARPSSAP